MSSGTVAILIQARIHSTRLPEKIFAKLNDLTMLEQIQRRCKAVQLRGLNKQVLVACPKADEEAIYARTGIAAFPGPEKDVLTRLLDAACSVNAEKFVRVTSDCPFICPRMIEGMIKEAYFSNRPVVNNWVCRRFPNGADLEVYDVNWLKRFSEKLEDEGDREWFASVITRTMGGSVIRSIINPQDLSHYRLTVDHAEDLELARRIYKVMNNGIWDMSTIVDYMGANPHLMRINRMHNTETGARPI